jgi:hypothetical protein
LNLRESLVTPQLLKRYQFALIHVTQFFADCAMAVSAMEDLDEAVCSWIEHIFFEGESKSLASDGLASIQYHLRMSWKLAKAWQKIEPPERVVPISPLLTRAFAGACIIAGKVSEAACILTAFDALLRPGEIYLLKVKDISFYSQNAVITLRDTKTGKRKSSAEMVVVESRLALKFLRRACQNRAPNSPLLVDGAPSFRQLFKNLVAHFQLTGLFAVYFSQTGRSYPCLFDAWQHGKDAPTRALV